MRAEYVAPTLEAADLVSLLGISPRGIPAGAWLDDGLGEHRAGWFGEELLDLLQGMQTDFRLVDLRVNGADAVAVRVGGRWRWILADAQSEDVLSGREVASYQWFSESGGAPIGWDGGNALTLLADGVLYDE